MCFSKTHSGRPAKTCLMEPSIRFERTFDVKELKAVIKLLENIYHIQKCLQNFITINFETSLQPIFVAEQRQSVKPNLLCYIIKCLFFFLSEGCANFCTPQCVESARVKPCCDSFHFPSNRHHFSFHFQKQPLMLVYISVD